MKRKFVIVLAALALTAGGAQACSFQHQAAAEKAPDAAVATVSSDGGQVVDSADVAIADVSVGNHLATE